jgi:hypothetical protein
VEIWTNVYFDSNAVRVALAGPGAVSAPAVRGRDVRGERSTSRCERGRRRVRSARSPRGRQRSCHPRRDECRTHVGERTQRALRRPRRGSTDASTALRKLDYSTNGRNAIRRATTAGSTSVASRRSPSPSTTPNSGSNSSARGPRTRPRGGPPEPRAPEARVRPPFPSVRRRRRGRVHPRGPRSNPSRRRLTTGAGLRATVSNTRSRLRAFERLGEAKETRGEAWTGSRR